MRKPVPGIRFFKCDECGYKWFDKTRDCGSPSGDHCLICANFVSPCDSEEHPEWQTDKSGNLIR